MSADRYPLCWPQAFPRTKTREKGQFRTTIAGALSNVETSLKAFARDSGKPISDIILSSNVTLGVMRPDDPGVAAWFTWDGMSVCIPVDRYATPEANLQAIHHVIEARRVELRHGTLALVRATMSGFLALPSPKGRAWHEVLGVSEKAGKGDVEAAFKRLARERHPDKGGSDTLMAELNQARDAALATLENAHAR